MRDTEVSKRWGDIKAASDLDDMEEQSGPEPLQRNWRPPANAGLPPALAHPVFGTLIDALASTVTPSKADMDAAVELCRIASAYYLFEVCSLPDQAFHGGSLSGFPRVAAACRRGRPVQCTSVADGLCSPHAL